MNDHNNDIHHGDNDKNDYYHYHNDGNNKMITIPTITIATMITGDDKGNENNMIVTIMIY